ncbi:MAG: helix-turn-helix domain-containing protein, partial [Anaerolineae bacterium]|nr:helix-turn-helix domain-containing protein [Anaerolineae bacterium]
MIYARQPTEEEDKELKRMVRQAVGRISQRATLILLSARGKTVPELADLFELSEVTVRLWIKRFNTHGPAGLYDQPRPGRPRKATPAVQEAIVQMVQDDPQWEGYVATS